MRGQRFLAVVAPVLLVGLGLSVPVTASASSEPSYYLALGDSLSVGFQPTFSHPTGTPTDRGYASDLHDALRLRDPGLQLVKLGCPGETSTTMMDGSGGLNPYCPEYASPASSQLSAALAFLEKHPGQVSLVTIDIGANDVDGCFIPTETAAEIEACVFAAVPTLAANLGGILHQIVETLASLDPGGRIMGMNYYDPFLADYLSPGGQTLAEGSVELADAVNAELATVYGDFRVPVAGVAGAFQTDNFGLIPFIHIPTNVALICAWTWMCAPSPYGPNIHANDIGYAVIAGTFLAELRGHGFP
ncbi:MAG: SGNH/GDSL hydrolase family protein [Candidatus Dormiibacterota bacterium]